MIKNYLKKRLSAIVMYLILWIIFPLSQYLYGLSVRAAVYGMAVVSVIFALWLIVDAIKYIGRSKRLDRIKENISEYPNDFPDSIEYTEVQYQQIIQKLYKKIHDCISELESNYNSQNEYYTMWVHQIKTPVSAIRLALESDRELSSPTRSLLEQELFKIEQYIEMALQFVKMQDISSDTVITECNVLNLVRQSVKKFAPLFIYKKLSVEIDEKLDFNVYTDEKWLCFIIEQLLSNAVKYTPDGCISFARENGKLTIKDTGIGILPNDIDRIFEKGYTGYNGRLDKKASGIGLYMVKTISNQLSISIKIDSTVGQGTKVTLGIPTNKAEMYDNMTQ